MMSPILLCPFRENMTSFSVLFCCLALESLGLWEDVRGIVLGSELVTGFPWTFKVPGLPQYLQSLTKLAIPEVWASLAEAEGQAAALPLSFSRLLESSFPEVRLLTLDTLLERAISSELGEKGSPPLLCSMREEFLLLAMKENHPGCFCRVGSRCTDTPLCPTFIWKPPGRYKRGKQVRLVLSGATDSSLASLRPGSSLLLGFMCRRVPGGQWYCSQRLISCRSSPSVFRKGHRELAVGVDREHSRQCSPTSLRTRVQLSSTPVNGILPVMPALGVKMGSLGKAG